MNTPNQDPSQEPFEVEFDLAADQADEQGERAPSRQPAAQARLSSRARTWRILLIASALLVLAAVVLGNLPTARNQIVGFVQRFIPTPTPTLPPGADRFYIATDVPWTTVSLDGHRITLPRIGMDAPLHLARGHHVLAWTATPFQPQQCFLSVPDTTVPSCFVIDQVRQGRSGALAQVVVLGESLSTLPSNQQQMLIQTTQAALSGFSDTVQPGEAYFAERSGETAVSQPLRATLNMQVQLDNASSCVVTFMGGANNDCTIGDETCDTFCTVPWQYRLAEPSVQERQEWLTFGMIRSFWDYTDANGQPVALNQPIGSGRAPIVSQLVFFRIAWSGLAWQVQPLFGPEQGPPIFLYGTQVADDPACLAAEDIFSQYQNNYARLRFVSGPNPAAGCLIEATLTTPAGTPAADAPVEEYLLRFGLCCLAANDRAHQQRPQWPLADAHEQQLAQQLAALPGGLIATGQM